MMCPKCQGTDLADLVNGKRFCMDCEAGWSSKEDKKNEWILHKFNNSFEKDMQDGSQAILSSQEVK